MFTSPSDDLNATVARHTRALKVVLEPLLVMLSAYGGTEALKLPRAVYSAILLVLRPAESALRRLIVIAARDLASDVLPAKVRPSRPVPKPRLVQGRSSINSIAAFRLSDPRQTFRQNRLAPARKLPRAFFIAADPPFAPLFAPPPATPAESEPIPSEDRNSRRLCTRVRAILQALEDVPQQAKRLVRLRARREAQKSVFAPLRPGSPPGHRNTPRRGVDFVLRECHSLARSVLAAPNPPLANTS
jgi:hypothetical protein